MKVVLSIFIIFIGAGLYAQNSKLEAIYNQIPPVSDRLLCERADNYAETIALIETLSVQLEEMRVLLNEELKIHGDETYRIISGGFPTDEELKKAEKLSEADQQAFWAKVEAEQSRLDQMIAGNTLKYQAEKEMLNKKVADYQNELTAISAELSQIHYAAMKVNSDKRKEIYNTCMVNNSLTAFGKQQIAMIAVEFCSAVSPVLIKRLRFEYSNLKQNMSLYRRLTIIELAEFSTIKEEDVCRQNASLLDLNDLEILAQFLNSYKDMFNVLPDSTDDQYEEVQGFRL